ncbi:major facilitator superfamily domain-containing protein [Suillus ampliporus]|nr:major facilitator superfamily domain-containing protein [Suillus ampliporus]
MSAVHEKSDAAVEEKQVSPSDDALSRVSYAEGVGRDYELKCNLINRCFQEELIPLSRIGFGRYQWQLFVITGLGWLADNLWLQGLAVVLPQVQQELNPVRVEYAVLAEFAGLIVGATTWGILADLIGRRLSFNITLFLAGLFGLAAGGAPNFVAFSSLIAVMGFGIGGNLPVDGALYLEHIPQSHQWTLTLLSVWWALGQLVASLISWGFIANFSCNPSIPSGQCAKSANMGWRYTLGALTFLMFICRFFVFDVQESSKFLVAQGRDEEAIKVLLQHYGLFSGSVERFHRSWNTLQGAMVDLLRSNSKICRQYLVIQHQSLHRICPLVFGMPFLECRCSASGSSSVSETYRNYTIVSVLGIPGSFIASAVVDYTRGTGRWLVGGRKLALAVSTMLTGLFLFLFTTSKTTAAVLGYSCASGLTQNAMYGVLYAYTPEVFPAPHRGTGDALCAALNRIGGLIAPLIKIATTPLSGTTSANTANGPVFVSAALFMVAAILTILLPIETAGKMAL